jgi:hypothetical protein
MSGFSQFLNNFPTFIVRLKLSLSPKIGIIFLKIQIIKGNQGFFSHLYHVAEMANHL